jgi:hypothetical protein
MAHENAIKTPTTSCHGMANHKHPNEVQ